MGKYVLAAVSAAWLVGIGAVLAVVMLGSVDTSTPPEPHGVTVTYSPSSEGGHG